VRSLGSLVLALGIAAFAAAGVDADTAGISFASATAVWDGMLHVPVRCDGADECRGSATVRVPDGSAVLAATDYRVDAGKTGSLLFDPGSSTTKQLSSASKVVVHIDPEPQGSQPLEATLSVTHETAPDNPPAPGTPKPLGPRTKFQSVKDKRGDSHDTFTHMDLVGASARRKGRIVIFKVTTANPPPHQHDSQGNPAAPCLEVPLGHGAGPGQHHRSAIQTCGDARLRGYTMKFWPKVPFSISGRTSTWRVPLKYLPKRQFKWRAYVADGWNTSDVAPNRGFKRFIR
jgi:hypothetical protein